jgi:hypothetical protein
VQRIRPLSLLIAVGLLVAAAAATLSDIVPHLMDRFGHLSLRVSQIIDGPFGVEAVDRTDIPFDTNQLAHLTGWATIMVVLALLLPRVPIAVIALGAFGLSAMLEPMQSRFSTSRSFSYEDIATNATGVLIGLAVAVAWRMAIAVVQRRPLLGQI